MRFNVNKLGRVDENAKNIFRAVPPYYYLSNKNSKNNESEKKKVIFFGCCFKNLPRDVNFHEYVKITNQCLDFVRRECAECELYYKPHPAETDESKLLNLNSFKIERDKTIGEMFLCKNLNRIKYVFSAHSLISRSAYSFGLNSYVFVRLFKSAFGEFTQNGYQDLIGSMPEPYFISNLNQNIEENKVALVKDDFLEKHLAESLNKNKGKVWLIDCGDPAFLPIIISFTKLIKNISSGRKVSLIITRHERWNSINIDEIRNDFDDIVFFPRVIASLRPARLLDMIKTVLAAKKFKINAGDILVGVGTGSFIENCLISYFKNNLSIGLIMQKAFEYNYNFKIPLKSSNYSIKWVRLFFNKMIQPLLGLYQTVERLHRLGEYGGFGIGRYQRPINEVFGMVYILKLTNEINSPALNKIW